MTVPVAVPLLMLLLAVPLTVPLVACGGFVVVAGLVVVALLLHKQAIAVCSHECGIPLLPPPPHARAMFKYTTRAPF